MIYSKFTDNQEDNEETTLVSNTTTATTTTSTTTQSTTSDISNEPSKVPQFASISVDSLGKSFHKDTPASTLYTPYINRTYLKNLDTVNLERNMQIRHDLIVEEGFRASLPKLDLTEEAENMYWEAIKIEVAELQLPERKDSPRLRALISEIREMMIDLYPRCDVVTGEYAEFLEDGEFIIQQLKLGTLDIRGFFQFLGHVMKKNCAPKRDILVDTMINCECPIEGLKSALKLIELMKLDLANFKLDQLRPIIAKTAVSTERQFFSQLFNNGKLNLNLTTKWLLSALKHSEGKSVYDDFLDATIRLLVSPFVKDTCNVPETFILDKKRLIGLHGKFQDLCIVQCLLLIFKQASGSKPCPSSVQLKRELLRLLEQPDTQISDISDLLIKCLNENNQTNTVDFEYIHSALNNIISPDNELFLLIEGKLLKRAKSKLKAETLTSSGFSELNVLDEFDELIKKFEILLKFNWSVFEPIYQNLLDKTSRE